MKADALSPRQLFDGNVHYEIPAFQRPYVWSEENQWAPLWDDVRRVAESVALADNSSPQHFLGAVVYESKPHKVGDVARHYVIDGQQRTTTLQVMIDAVHQVIAERGHDFMANDLERLILNSSPAFMGKPERFKLWPSRSDQEAFSQAMDPQPGWVGDHRIILAHDFFRGEVEEWLAGEPDADGKYPPGDEEERVAALSETLQNRLYVVAINLTGHDDSQLIFETLNDRGTPLLKADLIKNWVFKEGETLGAAVDSWPETHWVDFDEDWWRAEIPQGRHTRSRIDIFLQYWLTMRLRDDVKTDQVFREFTTYAKPLMTDAEAAEQLLTELRTDADLYRKFGELGADTPEGTFFSRVIETMELAATTPLLLWMLSPNHKVPEDQIRIGLNALESWVIRRTLLRRTMKDVNKMMVAILKSLEGRVDDAGEAVRDFLTRQTADARVWPTDETMRVELPSIRLYGNIRQGRLRVVLGAVELKLRTEKHENVTLPQKLEIEHVMPRAWRSHWDPQKRLSVEQAGERDKRLNTLGNLTLVTPGLNGALSNRPWTDEEAKDLKSGGHPGWGKRSLLGKYSLLALSNDLTQGHPDAWTDAAIDARSSALTGIICEVWPGPDASGGAPQSLAPPTSTANDQVGLASAPWTTEELAAVATSSTDLTLRVLDFVAVRHPDELLTGADFTDLGLTGDQVAGVSGALARKVYEDYQRSNPPLSFVKSEGRWHYVMPSEVAAKWRAIRNLT